jgi:hypothetical protein
VACQDPPDVVWELPLPAEPSCVELELDEVPVVSEPELDPELELVPLELVEPEAAAEVVVPVVDERATAATAREAATLQITMVERTAAVRRRPASLGLSMDCS